MRRIMVKLHHILHKVLSQSTLYLRRTEEFDDDDDFCYKRVQTPGMSPPRAGAWTYCLFTP